MATSMACPPQNGDFSASVEPHPLRHSGTARPTCLQVARAVSPMVAGMIPAAVVMQRRVRHHLATSAAAAAGGAFFEAVEAFLSAGIPRAVIARRAIAA